MNAAQNLHDRLWARFQQSQNPDSVLNVTENAPRGESEQPDSVLNVTCARETERHPTPLFSDSLSARARVSDTQDARRVRLLSRGAPVESDRPRWCDLSSTLFWLYRRGWPALDVDGVTIHGEAQWRAWVPRASLSALLGVRDRVADDATD